MKPTTYPNLDDVMRSINQTHFNAASCGSCRAIHTGSCDIPNAPYYVLSNDTFMSGWGLAKNRINVCVVPCATVDEALIVERYLKQERTDQKYVRIVIHKPRARGRLLSLLLEWCYNALNIEEPR